MQLETHEDAVNLVKDVFKSMGGRVVPPRRPGCLHEYDCITLQRDNFMMDFENSCLSQNWDSSAKPHPKGNKRYKDPEWAAMIESQVYPYHSDVDWHEYVNWVSRGFGDDWFREDETDDEGDTTPPPPPIRNIDYLVCKIHNSGPLDCWYDCDACLQECDTMPRDDRYKLVYTS